MIGKNEMTKGESKNYQDEMFVIIIQVSVAQWIARRTSNPEVVGSSPT